MRNGIQRSRAPKTKYAEAHYNLGLALHQAGKESESGVEFEKAYAISPELRNVPVPEHRRGWGSLSFWLSYDWKISSGHLASAKSEETPRIPAIMFFGIVNGAHKCRQVKLEEFEKLSR